MSYGRAYEEDPAYVAWSKTHLVGPQTHGAALDWGEYVRARELLGWQHRWHFASNRNSVPLL